LRSVDELLPEIEDARGTIDAAGKLPEHVTALLAKAGVFGMLLPQSYGGLELDPLSFIDVIERLSCADGSVGWVAAIASAPSGYPASRLPEPVVRSIWKNPQTVVCGNIAVPAGVAMRVDGGYRVSGRWSFGSGSYNSDWLAAACAVKDAGDRDADTPAPREE